MGRGTWGVGALLMAAACAPERPFNTVFFASGADLQSINPLLTTHPLAKQVQRYVLFTTLVQRDSALNIVPYFAERWDWSADRRTLTMHLREGLRWHDGRPTTAEDVSFTLDAARDPATGYPRGSELDCVSTVRRLDALTVGIEFCRAQEHIPDVLTDLAILPAHLLNDVPRAAMAQAAFNERPVGNGPYRFVEHVSRRRWVFERNPDFPAAMNGSPALARFVVVVVDEATTKLAGLVGGELDLAGITPMHASVVARVDGRAVVDYPLLFSYGLVWNTGRAPFADPRVRRALTLALDRRQLIDAVLYGYAEPADGPVPSAHPLAAPVEPVPFDRAAARALLDALGYGGRRRLAFTLATVGSADNVLEQLIQAQLAAVGVDVRIRQLELGAFLAAASGGNRDYDALVTGIPGDLALGYLTALFDSRRRAGPLQYAQYANASLDAALDRGDLADVQRIVARELPITFLYHARGVQGVNTRVRGIRMDLRGELASLHDWHLSAVGSGQSAVGGRQ